MNSALIKHILNLTKERIDFAQRDKHLGVRLSTSTIAQHRLESKAA